MMFFLCLRCRPAQSWSLHPVTPTRSSPPPKEEPERKPPKGVALQFDINSVGKQVGHITITLIVKSLKRVFILDDHNSLHNKITIHFFLKPK